MQGKRSRGIVQNCGAWRRSGHSSVRFAVLDTERSNFGKAKIQERDAQGQGVEQGMQEEQHWLGTQASRSVGDAPQRLWFTGTLLRDGDGPTALRLRFLLFLS
ncbi:hypothetical protein H920_02491 [Fukomys damarensis]|uniref:Uncharacterized protein n=1 Tax=Fukomys damarensis TaxID=885580 RepID=A0A091DYF8_FUKDA|nr:hypothetical protein H920_02491 [Fukomys damarensis]